MVLVGCPGGVSQRGVTKWGAGKGAPDRVVAFPETAYPPPSARRPRRRGTGYGSFFTWWFSAEVENLS